ncbi:MAG: type II secretion system minor pseudopilin GspK [Pseudomonadota bacterium]
MPRRPRPEPCCRRESGVALLTVLVVVAIATVLCVGMIRSQQQALQHAAGLFQQDQAWLYTQGAEEFVREMLAADQRSDKRKNRPVDHPGEAWARPFPPYPVEGGMVRARVEDLQSRFNVNRLGAEAESDGPAHVIFRQLLQNLGLPDNLGPALADWIDEDDSPRPVDGAEDEAYSRLPQPYRVANQPLADLSELRLVAGFTPQVIARLRPHVVALPAEALLNINTATPTLLGALLPALTPSAAGELARQRPSDGYASVDDFLGQPVFNGLDNDGKNRLREQVAVGSQYFQLVADAEMAGRHSILHAMMVRADSGTLRIVARDYSRKVVEAAPAKKQESAPDSPPPDQESPR